MNTMKSVLAGVALLASSVAALPAQAAMHPMGMAPHYDMGRMQSEVIAWCKTHPYDSDCHDWNGPNHPKWAYSDYQHWYYRHHGEHGFDPAWAAIFGIAAVAGAAAAASH